jgi:hypothetical protein
LSFIKPKLSFMKRMLLCGLLSLCVTGAQAQFIGASVPDLPYPSGNPVLRPDDLHCYSAEVPIGGNMYTLNVYGWNSAGNIGEGFAWRLMSGPTLVNSGVVPIPNSSSIDLGIVYEPNTNIVKVIVGYHKTGSGHVLEIYNAGLGGLSLVTSMGLSGTSALPTIAVDAHKLYGVLVSWSDPGVGIHVKTLNTNTGTLTIGTSHVLSNTFKSSDPDITFTHDNNSGLLNAHVAFHRNSPDQMEEQSMDFFAMHNSAPVPFTGNVNDVYPIPAGWAVGRPSIDAPEHATVEHWAYAFSMYDPGTLLGPVVSRVNDGNTYTVTQYDMTEGPYGATAPGPWDLSGRYNVGPCLAFDQNQDSYRVAWFFNSNATMPNGKYIVQKIDVFGNLANPGGAYLDAEMNPAGNTSASRCITLNPNNSTAENFTAYGNFNGSIYSIKVKSLPWNAVTFRAPLNVSGTTVVAPDFSLSPNPTHEAPSMSFAGPLGDADMDAVMLNSAGQIVASAHGNGQAISMQLMNRWSSLPAGMYTIRILAGTINYSGAQSLIKM